MSKQANLRQRYKNQYLQAKTKEKLEQIEKKLYRYKLIAAGLILLSWIIAVFFLGNFAEDLKLVGALGGVLNRVVIYWFSQNTKQLLQLPLLVLVLTGIITGLVLALIIDWLDIPIVDNRLILIILGTFIAWQH